MDRFIELVQKKITGEISEFEEKEFNQLIENNDDLGKIYTALFQKSRISTSQQEVLRAEEAYAVHFVKMQIMKKFDEK
jgi:transmembrane sensor